MLPSSGQGSASVCTPKAPCSDVCNRAYIYCTRSPLLRFTGSIASTRTFTATATLSTLTPRQLYAPIQPRRCTATGGTPYQSGTSRSFVRNPRRTNNQEAVIHLEEAGCRTSPTSRPLKGTASSRVADRVANSHQQPHNRSSYGQSNNTRTSGRPQNQQQQYRHKAQVTPLHMTPQRCCKIVYPHTISAVKWLFALDTADTYCSVRPYSGATSMHLSMQCCRLACRSSQSSS